MGGWNLGVQWEPPTRCEAGGEGEHHPLQASPGASKLRAKLRTKKKKGGVEGGGGGSWSPSPLPPAGRQRRNRPGSSSRGCPVV